MVRASACACCLHRGLPPHGLKRNPPVPVQAMYSTPPKLSHFGSFFVLRKRPEFGTKRPAPAASTGWRSGHSGTLQGANSGTQTHSRRTGSKLGRLHRARQGLVRVPESNTKYGGKRGKTGGPRRRCYAQVSVSPQGFPSEKNRLWGAASPSSRCSQGNYLLWPRACLEQTHVKLRGRSGHVRSDMPCRPWSAASISGKVALIPTGPTLS